ncbi:hypothetical protein SASC598J21_000040, partial [Snodgrassella alvi SCGC AB-598-J21]
LVLSVLCKGMVPPNNMIPEFTKIFNSEAL